MQGQQSTGYLLEEVQAGLSYPKKCNYFDQTKNLDSVPAILNQRTSQ